MVSNVRVLLAMVALMLEVGYRGGRDSTLER
jgi:hypothetical protein